MRKFFRLDILHLLCLFTTSRLVASSEDVSTPPYPKKNIEIFADALYWTVSETVDWVVILVQEITSGHTNYDTLDFDWEPGFRVGLGYNLGHDQWKTELYYTYYRAETSAHADAGTGLIEPAFLGNRTASASLLTFNYQTGKINWRLQFDMLDWDLGRKYCVGNSLMIQPFIGLKGGWINQRIHSKWRNPNLFLIEGLLVSTENLKNDFAGIGPKGGVNTKWILGCPDTWYFSLFGDFAAAFMWGSWTIRDHFKTNRGEKAEVTVGDRHFGSFMAQAFLGIGFDANIRCDRAHLAFKVGYEIQDWFNQFQIFDNGTGGHTNDLILQGLTVDVRFDF